ncbi:HAD family hydrolase [Streptomyces sp. NPDC001351]|uniref:HAD family hydrolase n=1 Tax=Streptomyces sp. NPDC001351 TaxID=3364564 RepID=UPI00367BE8E0
MRYEAHRNAAWAAFPDAEPVFRKLAPDYRLGIVSKSSAEHQHDKLHTIGLLPYLDNALICSDQHGAAKPAPSIFLAGCTSLGLPPHERRGLPPGHTAHVRRQIDRSVVPVSAASRKALLRPGSSLTIRSTQAQQKALAVPCRPLCVRS